jgi:hypothetical protein
MTFDSVQYETSTRQQWQDYACGWNKSAPLTDGFVGPCELVIAGASR